MSSITITAVLMMIITVIPAFSATGDTDVSELIARRRYDEAIGLSKHILESDETLPSVKAATLQTMARFYEYDVGDCDKAIDLYNRLDALPLSQDDPFRKEAGDALDRLLIRRTQFSDVYVKLDNISKATATRDNAESTIRSLSAIQQKNPDFPEPETIGYYLGLYYYLDGQYKRAYKTLNLAAAQKRAVEVKLPNFPRLRYQAKQKWMETFIHTTAWTIVGIFIIATLMIFIFAKPWRWLGLRHLILLLSLTVAWYGIFTFASKRIGAHAQETVAHTPGELTSKFSTFGNPAEDAFKALFRYGLIGTIGVWIFAVATARLRLRRTTVILNGVVAFILFSSLMAVFYERYGKQGRTHLPMKNPGLRDRLKTVILYTTEEIEPFLLTNPTAFPNLNIMTIRDPAVREWFLPYLVKTSAPHREIKYPPGEGGQKEAGQS